jgi:magnesium chelatase subunit I
MDHEERLPESPPPAESYNPVGVRSLRELIDLVSGRNIQTSQDQEDSGLAEILPFPFLGLVGQMEMKLALLLSLINPAIGGVLLIGPRGTGKTTAVRSLLNLLPEIKRSACFYGCTEEDIEAGGIDAVCPDCAKKYAEGHPLTRMDSVRLVELPLNAQLEDVIGSLDDRIGIHERFRLKRGILAQADLNVLYIDEVNMLGDEIVDAILDAAANGKYLIKRNEVRAIYNSRFSLVGSMNPEEGDIRPQIMDRFGLRVVVRGLTEISERLEAYQRVRLYRSNPHNVIRQFSEVTAQARDEIIAARSLLPRVILPEAVAHQGIQLIRRLDIDSLRSEITLLEAARAYSAADNRTEVTPQDIAIVAPMALRLRRSDFMNHYFKERDKEDVELKKAISTLLPDSPEDREIKP